MNIEVLKMLDKLQSVEHRYEEISNRLGEPDVLGNQEEYKILMKEFTEIEEIVAKFREYKKVKSDIQEAKQLIETSKDKEFIEMVEEELKELLIRERGLSKAVKLLLVPKDPNDEKSVIVEIRAGAGGEEAALFVGVLFRMYAKYAERNRWSVQMIDSNATDIGGFKEVVFSIEAKGAYSKLKFESGVHRVQRVPSTESSGRIHTSTVTVAVLPEVEEVEVEINPGDLRIDTYRAGGAGGQHINKTDSAVRITHIPTGLVVACQDERSQHKNKDKAMTVLRARLYEMYQQQQDSDQAQSRKSQVGTGDRSERIRTYNYPQGRVTDHRIGLTIYRIEEMLEGDMEEVVEALVTEEQTKKLANAGGDNFEF
jgi:peptide chain release factor 1